MRFYEYVGPRECRLSERLGYHAPGTQIALELTVRSERGVQSEDSKGPVPHGEELSSLTKYKGACNEQRASRTGFVVTQTVFISDTTNWKPRSRR
jgi:hypothetical protein